MKKKKPAKKKFSRTDQQEQMVRDRAYFIWEMRGRPQGSQADDWAEAEKEMIEEGYIKG